MIYLTDVLLFLGVLMLCFGYMVTKYTFSKKEECWGVKISLNSSIQNARAMLGWSVVVFVIALVVWVVAMVNDTDYFDMDLIGMYFVPMALAIIPIPIGLIFGERWITKKIQESRETIALERFAIIGVINELLANNESRISCIGVFCDGVAFFDSTNYAFATINFNSYQLGNLLNSKQMLMLSTYFVQKYPGKFKMKLVEEFKVTTTTGNSAADLAGSVTNIANANIQYIKLIKK